MSQLKNGENCLLLPIFEIILFFSYRLRFKSLFVVLITIRLKQIKLRWLQPIVKLFFRKFRMQETHLLYILLAGKSVSSLNFLLNTSRHFWRQCRRNCIPLLIKLNLTSSQHMISICR